MIHQRYVLLVHPPFICPAAPPLLPAMAAARLRGAGAAVQIYDANHEFFFDHLLKPDFLKNCLAQVLKRRDKGAFQNLSDLFLTEQLKGMAGNQALWQKRCEKAREIPEVMRGQSFYDPGALVAARGKLDALLALASLAFFPLRLHWNGLHHPNVRDWDSAWAFSEKPDNPFHSLSERCKEVCQSAQSLLFCVPRQDQLLPALTLWAGIKDERPDLEAVFWGPGLNALQPLQGVTWLAEDDPTVLCAALKLKNPGPKPPDYADLGNYLSPKAETAGVRQYQMDQIPSLDALQEDKAAGVVVAGWTVGREAELKNIHQALRMGSKVGMWNKVELDGEVGPDLMAWCAANPNLAHSVTAKGQAGPGFSGPPPGPWPVEPMVGTLPPMPGRPFWRWLDQDLHLALYVRQYEVRQIRTTRMRDDNTVYHLGEGVDYYFVHYPDLNEWHISNILKLINFAGKVKPDWLKYNLERSYLVAYVLEEGMMVATETLKHPRPEYIRKMRERTGLDFSKHLERGYIVVRPEYRGFGIGDKLIQGCLARAKGYKTYLTIGAENKVAQQLAGRNDTRYLTRFYSEEMGKVIEVWTPRDQEDYPEEDET